MATSTIDTDTELSAVNSILGSIGQSPVTTLNFTNPEVSYIYNLLTEVNKDVQNEGWHFNTEQHVKVTPDANKNIILPVNILRYTLHDGGIDRKQDIVVRDGKLYDLVDHTDEFTTDLYLDVVTLYKFEDLPNPFQRYITYRAASRAATQLVSNPQLVQLLQQQEALSRSTCVEYECSQADHSYFGFEHQTNYRPYKPSQVIAR